MIAEVNKALAAYKVLDTVGRRLFRDELGLVRVQQAAPRRRKRQVVTMPVPAEVPVRRGPRKKVMTAAEAGNGRDAQALAPLPADSPARELHG